MFFVATDKLERCPLAVSSMLVVRDFFFGLKLSCCGASTISLSLFLAPSQVCQFYGMHRVKMYHLRRKLHFVVMRSVVDTACKIHTMQERLPIYYFKKRMPMLLESPRHTPVFISISSLSHVLLSFPC